MSHKRPRSRFERLTSPMMRRVAMSVVVGGLATALVVVYIDRNGKDNKVVTVSTPVATTTGTTPVAALNGTYDVIVTVVSAEYGATWPGPQLTPSAPVTQQWSITCRANSCAVKVTSGHVSRRPRWCQRVHFRQQDVRGFGDDARQPRLAIPSAGLRRGQRHRSPTVHAPRHRCGREVQRHLRRAPSDDPCRRPDRRRHGLVRQLQRITDAHRSAPDLTIKQTSRLLDSSHRQDKHRPVVT